MILHILGGGPGQLAAVHRCRSLGIKTFVTDINTWAPGCLAADFCAGASTFDADATITAAGRFAVETGLSIDALLVTGTDQPVLTAARTAAELGVPYFLSVEQALTVTNKKTMKTILACAGIPTAPFHFIGRDFNGSDLGGLRFPVVIKPLDSQGQRGVYRLETVQAVRETIDEVLSYSRCSEALVEEFYPSDEITLSGWVEKGYLYVLSVTDRVTVENPPSIGVCVAHHYPSKHSGRMDEIRYLTERIVIAANISDGPIYFQYLVGSKGIIVNEIACRLGGAYEDQFIPFITGIDILDVMIKFSCRMEYGPLLRHADERVVSLQMFFCGEGVIKAQHGMDEVLLMKGVTGGEFLQKPGVKITNRKNSTQRAGYFIVCGTDRDKVDETVRKAYAMLKIEDETGENMIQFYDKMLFGGNG